MQNITFSAEVINVIHADSVFNIAKEQRNVIKLKIEADKKSSAHSECTEA